MHSQDEWHVFLIQNKGYEEFWGCPKGCIEPGEELMQTAKRELKEETNLDVLRVLEEQPFIEEFSYLLEGRRIFKRVYYFLAECSGTPELQKEELSGGKWFSFEDAIHQVIHPEGKVTLQAARDLLQRF